MFLSEKRNIKLNGALLLLYCFFCAVFATIQRSPIATNQINNAAIRDGVAKLSFEERFMRTRPPNAYIVRIEGCSELIMKSPNVKKYETRPFSVGGFNWTFIIEPFGNKTDIGTWISAYVAIDPSGLVGENREVYADLRFLAYSKGSDQYWTSMDTELAQFKRVQTTRGNPNFIRHVDFQNAERQYIFDNDQCEFGVDISVYPHFNKWEVLSIDKTVSGPKSWNLLKFSTLTRDFYISDEFTVGGKKLAFKVYPNGKGTGEGNSLSVYVILSGNQSLKPYEKVYVRAKLRVLDKKQSNHLEKPILAWFDTPGEGSGYEKFVSLSDLKNPAKGFLVNDVLSVQVEFEAISSTNYYPSNVAQLLSSF